MPSPLWSRVDTLVRKGGNSGRPMRTPATQFQPAPRRAAPSAAARPGVPVWLMACLLLGATIMAYQPVWHAGFFWDDDRHVADNRQLVVPGGWQQIWCSPDSLQYYPMVFSAFRLERSLWGLNPAPYHWLNILLHACSALLLWRVLDRLRLPGAWLGAALFALHPVNVESAAWICQLKNTLAMVFYLLSVLWFLKSEAGTRTSAAQDS